MPRLNNKVEIWQRSYGGKFPTETLTLLHTTWSDVTQLANQVGNNQEAVQSTERISVVIRYRQLPESLLIKFNGVSYNVTEINRGSFDKRFITLFAERIEGAN